MRLVLLGPPGAGKGTQADLLSSRYKIPQISTGDILREAVRENSDVGRKAKSYMDKGELVPDDVVTEIVAKRLEKPDAAGGFILDGYPRTERQAESLSGALDAKGITIDRVIYFKTPAPIIVARLTGRRTCPKCNAIFHINNNPPAKEGICDKCGSGLIQRKDDREETIRKRLEVYERTQERLLAYYNTKGMMHKASGEMDAKTLFESLLGYFEREGLS